MDMRKEEDRTVIEPVRSVEYDIVSLVAAITDENRHELLETG